VRVHAVHVFGRAATVLAPGRHGTPEPVRVFSQPGSTTDGQMRTASSAVTAGVRGLRWWIIGLVFLATLINFIDRLTISVLAPVITVQFGLTNLQFASISTWFLVAYTASQGLSGKLYDRIGTRRGFTFSILLWSAASMAHAFSRGLASLSCFRFLLGLGEAGNWPGAAKAIAEWFPARQRALGMGIFNSGVSVGSILAPPLIVWLQLQFGWRVRTPAMQAGLTMRRLTFREIFSSTTHL
jgi:ACS family hexuronate transporter-like MFS transporter